MLYLKLAWRNIWRNKRRTLITIASILFAVFFAVVMRSVQEGSYAKMVDNMVRFYTGHGQIQDKDYWEEKTIDNSLAYKDSFTELERTNDHLDFVVPRMESFALASSGNLTKGVMVLGIHPEKEKHVMNLEGKLDTGKYIQSNDKAALIGKGLAKSLKLGLGDTLVLIGSGYHGANAAGKFPIKGIIKYPLPDIDKQAVFLPLKEAQWFYAAEDRMTSMVLMVDKAKNVDGVVKNVKASLGSEEYEVMSWAEMMPEVVQQIELDRSSGKIMLWILYAIIGFGIFGTILMMTAERRREFGVLMSIGMSRGRLILVTWLEIIMLGFLGVLAGIAVSFPFCYYFYKNPFRFTGEMQDVYEKMGIEAVLQASIDPSIFLNQAFLIFIITSILAIYPIIKIWNLQPVAAMRA